MKVSGIYKITNAATGDFYIGSSKNIESRWVTHKCQSVWNKHPNNPMYIDMQKYGVEKFELQILEEVEPYSLKEKEQQFIETLKPTYNSNRANGWNVKRYKEYKKEYNKEYQNQLCFYNGEKLTLCALATRFRRAGVAHPTKEAKKYILKAQKSAIEFYDIYP